MRITSCKSRRAAAPPPLSAEIPQQVESGRRAANKSSRAAAPPPLSDIPQLTHVLPSPRPFSAWGGAKNYLGFNKRGHSNFYLYPDAQEPTVSALRPSRLKTGFSPYCYGSAGSATLPARLRDASTNCTCVAAAPSALYSLDCDASHVDNGYVPVLANNSYLLDTGAYSFPCNGAHWDLPTAQANGVDIGTVSGPSPGTADLLAMMAAFIDSQLKR